jgi:hypothetical protein
MPAVVGLVADIKEGLIILILGIFWGPLLLL